MERGLFRRREPQGELKFWLPKVSATNSEAELMRWKTGRATVSGHHI